MRNRRAATALSLKQAAMVLKRRLRTRYWCARSRKPVEGFRYPPTGFPGRSNGRYRYAPYLHLSIEAPECRVNGPGSPRVFLVRIGKSKLLARAISRIKFAKH